jgi:hypothetical protein
MRMTPVVMLLVFGVVTAASATPMLGPDSSWSDIRSTPNVYGRPPLIFFGTTGIPVTDVCTVEGRFHAVNRNSLTSEVPVAMHPLSYDIEVVETFEGKNPHSRLLFLKHLEIPACS